jgi:hypothetical protein
MEWGTSEVAMARESSMEKRAAKKNFKGFPMFLRLKIFKTAIKSDLKQWSSRQCRHRRSESKDERKMKKVKGNC